MITGAIVLLFLFPYLGGLLAQWTNAVFSSSSDPTPAVLFSPFVCYRTAWTPSGIQYTLFVSVVVCGIGFWFGKRFHSDVDTRNFTRRRTGTYGTAGWMSAAEQAAFI